MSPTRDVQVLDFEHACCPALDDGRRRGRDRRVDYPTDAFEADAEQLLRLDRELHRQLAEHFLAEAVDDHVDGVLGRDAALLAVEDLVLADLRRRRLVLDLRASCS